MRNLSLATGVATLVFIPGASAQNITPLVLQGDSYPGGLVTDLESIAITDLRETLIGIETDNPTTTADALMLKNLVMIQQEGAPVPAPAGATLVAFSARSLRSNGDAAFSWTLANTAGGTTDNAAVYVNSTLVVQKGSTPFAPGWGAGTTYNAFTYIGLNANNQILIRGSALDPTTTQVTDFYTSILSLSPSFAPVSELVLAKSGQILPGQLFGVNTVGTSVDGGAINASGQAIYRVSLSGAPATADAAVYLWDGTQNVLIANEGLPSPTAGFLWGDLTAPELTLNDAGDWVVKDVMDMGTTTHDVIVKNNVTFVRETDPVPGLPPFTFATFGNTPVSLTAAGNLLWYGDWNDTVTTQDTGIFLDNTLLIREGHTTVTIGAQSAVFTALGNVGNSATAGQNGSMYISPSGRFVIFTGALGAPISKRGIFLLDRGGNVTAGCFGDGSGTACPCANSGAAGNGCGNSTFSGGTNLSASGNAYTLADTLVLTATDIPGPGLYFQGSTPLGAGGPFGDGLLCVGGALVRFGVVFPTGNTSSYPGGTTPSPIGLAGGATPGSLLHYQCWYRDSAVFCTGDTFNLTNRVSVAWTN